MVRSSECLRAPPTDVEGAIARAVAALDFEHASRTFQEQGEFIVLDRFLEPDVVRRFAEEVDGVRPDVNRNYVPRFKKGGSVSFYRLRRAAPAMVSLYRSREFRELISRFAGTPLSLCPDDDPHSCALYVYTEPGDHIGFHYDTSFYKGARYTILIGVVDRSSSRLLCHLHSKDSSRENVELEIRTEPGSVILFNGDKLYHAVSPLGDGEERVVLTLQYVTDPSMGRMKRLLSDVKDAVAYFGLPALFRRERARA